MTLRYLCVIGLAAALAWTGLAPRAMAQTDDAGTNAMTALDNLTEEEMRESVIQNLLPAEFLETLAASQADLAAQFDDINAALEGNVEAIQGAENKFDSMIAAVRSAAGNGDPNGEFVSQIEALQSMAQEEAIAAANDGDTEMVGFFERQVQDYKRYKEMVTEMHGDSFRIIREIEQQKSFFVRRLKARQFSLAAETIKRGAELLQQVEGELSNIRGLMPQSSGPAD